MRDDEILASALSNFNAATEGKPIPQYGRWEHWAGEMRKVIGSFPDTFAAFNYAQNSSCLPFGHREKANPGLLDACYWIIRTEFPKLVDTLHSMSDDVRYPQETLIHADHGILSNMYLWHVWTVFTCRTHAPDARSIIEIGGGFGAVARLWCLYFPVGRYVLVDLPETLYFAEIYLRSLFGTEVEYFNGQLTTARIVLVPADKLYQYNEECDLVINIGSMQEMNDEYITRYMDWLDICGAKYFYSLNYAAQPLNELRESRCMWGPRPSPKWSTKVLQLDPAVIRIMCTRSHFLEALYLKQKPVSRFDAWSAFDGRGITGQVYLEGLDLIRQHPDPVDIKTFMTVIRDEYSDLAFLPKEMEALAQLVDCEVGRDILEYSKAHPTVTVQ